MDYRVSFADGIGFSGIILAVILLALDKAGKLKGGWLLGLLAIAAAMTLFLAIGNSWVLDAPAKWKIWRGTLLVGVVLLTYSGLAIWISGGREPREHVDKTATGLTNTSIPSLVFVFGVPLGANDSASWMMLLKHYGPDSAYNCDVAFFDDDRKNIEHLWLVNHGSPPFLPLGQFDESQKMLHIAEADPEGTIQLSGFNWSPIDPNSQHYTVSISCRDGVFVEKWEVMRVNGVLRSRITIEHGPQWIKNNPNLEPVVFRYEDPEFVRTALATEIPKATKGKVVHPGWKPKHRFEVPAAIIDPNGHVQILSGVKLPDGSTLTDFGSWNILTRHFGDNQAPSKQP
jgi:hypothetical protein